MECCCSSLCVEWDLCHSCRRIVSRSLRDQSDGNLLLSLWSREHVMLKKCLDLKFKKVLKRIWINPDVHETLTSIGTLACDTAFILDYFFHIFYLSVLCYSPGYRHVHLLKADGSSLSPATLFIHVKVVRRGVPIKTVSERIGKAWCFCHTVVPRNTEEKATEPSSWGAVTLQNETTWKKHDTGRIWTNSVRNNLKIVSVDLHLAFFLLLICGVRACYGHVMVEAK